MNQTAMQNSSWFLPGSDARGKIIDNASSLLSACLYWQDDYGRLVEWIAYHYQVAEL
jgi:hypothetical protein